MRLPSDFGSDHKNADRIAKFVETNYALTTKLYRPNTMSDAEGGESCEELLNLLHQRMISTGEWSSTLSQMRRMLEESGWETQLREQAESKLITFMVIYF